MTITNKPLLSQSEIRLLNDAFTKLLGAPSTGAVVFCRCLRSEHVQELAALTKEFSPSTWLVRAVVETSDAVTRQITSDQAVELREDKGGG